MLDRHTGQPLTKVEEVAVKPGTIPNEKYAATQPLSVGMPQIGTQTQWTPVKNLTFSADVTYVHLDQKYAGTITTSAGAIGKPVATYELKNQEDRKSVV